MLPESFVYLGLLIGSIGAISYLIDTVKGTVKPNRVSFLLWSLAPLIAFFAQLKEGVGTQSLLTFSVGFIPLLIFIATFLNKKSEWKLTKFDLTCGGLSILGFILWQITRVGDLAIALSIAADALAGVPTVIKAYKYPETESGWPWISAAINGLCTLLTVTTWKFAFVAFPLYILLFDLLIYIFVQFKLGKDSSRS